MNDRGKTHPLDSLKTDLPALGGPAQRALFNAGITSLASLSKRTKSEITALHGLGPSSIVLLEKALKKSGRRFKE